MLVMHLGGDNRFAFPVSRHSPALFREAACWGQLLQRISALLVMICFLLSKVQSWNYLLGIVLHLLMTTRQEFIKYPGAFFHHDPVRRVASRKRNHSFCGGCLAEKQDLGSFKLNAETPKCASCLPDGSLVCCAALTCSLIAACRVPRGLLDKQHVQPGLMLVGSRAGRLRVPRELQVGGFMLLGTGEVTWLWKSSSSLYVHLWGWLLDPGHLLLASRLGQNPGVLLRFRGWHSCGPWVHFWGWTVL